VPLGEIGLIDQKRKANNMELVRSTRIQKALKVGIGLCSDQIAENIYPIQREIKSLKKGLNRSISELTKLKLEKLRMY